MKNSRWYLLLTLFVMILCHGLQAQNVNDTSVVVRISGSARYYYGSTANNDSVNGLALQSALTAAAASDTFLLRSSSTGGTFQGNFTATEAGLALKGGYVGNAAEWHFNDVISDSSSLDGAQRGRVLLLSATSGTSIIENLVFKEGEVSGTDNYGAGLKLGNGGSLQLQGCSKFISNSATMHAGALVLVNGTAVIQDSVLFISNHANVDGGAISILGTTLTIKDKVKFITNDCVDYYGMGGAIYQESGVMTITDSVYFYDNSSGGGGAILVGGTLNLNGSVRFEENDSPEGGAIYQDGTMNLSGNVQVRNSIYLYNNRIINAPDGALGDSAVIDSIEVADAASGRVIVQYANYKPTPLVDTIAYAGSELAKYGYVDASGYQLYNGDNPYVVLNYTSTMQSRYAPNSYDVVMSNQTQTISYSAYAAVPDGATSVSISSNGSDSTMLSTKSFDVSGALYRYTQGLPGTTYTFTFNDAASTVSTATLAASPTFATALGSGYVNVALATTVVDSINSVTAMNNLQLAVTPAYGVSSGAQMKVKDSLFLYDGLSVEMDMSPFVNNGDSSVFAFISLPFDVDLYSGIRFETTTSSAAGGGNKSEVLARLNVDYLLRLYSSELRSEQGQGNENWVDITSLPYTGSEVLLTDGHIIPAGTGFIMLIVNSSYYGRSSTYPLGAGPKNNYYRFYATNPNVLGADVDLAMQVVSNGASSVKRHNEYSSTNWQQTWDDGLVLIGVPKSQPYSYSSNSNVPRFLYHRATNGTFGDFVTIDTEVTSAQPYTAYYGFMTPTALAVSETQTLTFSGYGTAPSAVRIPNRVSESDNFLLALLKDGVQKDMVGLYFNPNASAAYNRQKDAVKMGTTGIDILWSEMTSGAFSYYTQPFVGDTMRFELRVNSGSTGSYLLQPVGSLPEGYRLYVQWEGKSTQHPLTAQGYAIGRRGDLTLPLYIVKESGSETAVVAPELAGVQWYQKDDQLTIDGLAEGAVVTVWSVAGVCLAKVTSEGGRVVVNGVLPGVYVVQILQHQQHQSFKVLLR